MSRLPTPGADDGTWGDVLNDFLGVEHNPDGSLKKAGLITGAEQSANKGQANGYAPLDSSGMVPSANLPSGSTPDATTTSKGVIQLAGDLSGTAAAPTVPALANKADTASVLLKANNLSDVASATTARTNLGLGTAATKDVPASGNASTTQVVKGDDTRLSDSRTPADGSVTDAKITSGGLTNAAISATAAIAKSKLASLSIVDADVSAISESKVTNLTTDLASKLPVSTATAKGDLLAASAASTITRLGVGSDGQVLTADSTQTTGIKWAAQNAGGLEIAYAEITAGQGPFTNLISAPVDLTGLQIAIPAGTGNYVVELYIPLFQVNTTASWTAANGTLNALLQLVDEGGVILGAVSLKVATTAASQVYIEPMLIKKRMAATASAKTIKAQVGFFNQSTNMQIDVFAGPGTGTTNGGQAPGYIQAYTR